MSGFKVTAQILVELKAIKHSASHSAHRHCRPSRVQAKTRDHQIARCRQEQRGAQVGEVGEQAG